MQWSLTLRLGWLQLHVMTAHVSQTLLNRAACPLQSHVNILRYITPKSSQQLVVTCRFALPDPEQDVGLPVASSLVTRCSAPLPA